MFSKIGVNVIIYANHMLRAAYPGMMKVAKSILKHKRSLEAEPDFIPALVVPNLNPSTGCSSGRSEVPVAMPFTPVALARSYHSNA